VGGITVEISTEWEGADIRLSDDPRKERDLR